MPPEAVDTGSISVPLPRLAGFIRQVTHDVRNSLNAIDLQAAYLAELVTDTEARDEVRRLRGIIQSTARQLQGISSNFWTGTPNLVTYSAKILIEDLQDRLKKTFPEQSPRVAWHVRLDDESIALDLEMFFNAVARIFENTFQFGEAGATIEAHSFADGDEFVLEFHEPKTSLDSDPATWGEEPLVSTRRGGYGLGLYRARSFLAVLGGKLQISHDSGSNLLLTRVILPLAPPE
jgi:K+-sensing histidine kinase KdpD